MALSPFAWSTTIRRAEELLAFCQKVAEFLRTVSNVKLLDGQFVTVSFTASSTASVRHTLGRPYVGAFVVNGPQSTTTPMIVARPAYNAPDPANFLALGAQTAWTGSITLWVF